jgi:hypothetical protein
MYHYTGFDPYLIGERNRQIFEEVRELRMERRLRQGNEGRVTRVAAFAVRLKSMLSPLHKAGSAGQ